MLKFTDDCLIGIKEIDDEHRKLFQIINEASDAVKDNGSSIDAVINLVKQLKDYAATHFSHEEAYMEKTGDSELAEQKIEHRWFADKINGYDIDRLNDDNCRQIADEILNFATRWLYHHILGSDTMIGKIRTKSRQDSLTFSDKYRTGIQLIDDEHKRLFEIIKETDDLIREEYLHDKYDRIMHILEELAEYTVRHFADEEHYMEKIHYADIKMQKDAHASFINYIENIDIEELDDNQSDYLDSLVDFLLGWLTNHILYMDKKIPAQAK